MKESFSATPSNQDIPEEIVPESTEKSSFQLGEILPPIIQPKDLPLLKSLGLVAAVAMTPTSEVGAAEQVTTVEDADVIEAVIGPEVVRELEGRGFKITIPVKADANGSYIIHVGQTHSSPIAGLSRILTNAEVVSFQQTLHEVLPKISPLSRNVVFAEGATEDLSETRDYVRGKRTSLENMAQADFATVKEAFEAIDALDWYVDNRNNSFVRVHIPESIAQDLLKKLQSFTETFQPDPKETRLFSIMKRSVRILGSSFGISKFSSVLSGQAEGDDAISTLFMDGKIDIAAAESREANEKGIEALNAVREADKKLREAKRASADRTQLDALERQLEEAEQALKKAVFADREKVFLNKVSHYYSGKQATPHPEYNQHVVVVYGSAHKFASELTRHNQSNDPSEKDRGLIEIKKM